MTKTRKLSIIFSLCLAITLLVGVLTVTSPKTVSAATAEAPKSEWVVAKTKTDVIADSNYALASIMAPFDASPKLNGTEEYWGVKVRNTSTATSRARFGFEMGGGATTWIGRADTIVYLKTTEGTITPWTMTSAQYVDIPAGFDGVVYVKKTDMYGWSTDATTALVKNNYTCKGVRWGYDFRGTTAGSARLSGIYVADFTTVDQVTSISNEKFMLNFDNATMSRVYQGTLTDEVKTSITANLKIEQQGFASIDPAYAFVVDRTDTAKIASSNYAVASIMVPYDVAPKLNGTEEYWGIHVRNLLAQDTYMRYGLEFGGGVVCWMGRENTKLYLESKSGSVTEWTMTNAQNVLVPANFDGIIYLKKSDTYGWSTDTSSNLVKNGYAAKGVRFGFDCRVTGEFRIAAYGISIANISKDGDQISITDKLFKTNLNFATVSGKYCTNSSVAADIQTAMKATLSATRYAISDIDEVTSIALKTNPKTQYQVGETLSLDSSIVALTTKSGVVRELPLSSSQFTVTGFDSTAASDSQTITVSYSDTISTTYNVVITNLPVVTSIAIKTSPKTEYAYGEALDLTGGVITLNYDNDTSSELALDNEAFTVTGFDSKTITSSRTITVDYAGIKTTYTISVAAPVINSTKYWVVDRADSAKVSGSNYEVSSILVTYANGARLNGTEEYWGIDVVNLLATPARVRYGIELSGAVCWIGAANTKLYLVSKDGTIKEWTMTTGQFIDIPANFEGTIYLKKTDAYGWTTDTTKDLVKNKYTVKGVRLGYDFRNEYAAKLALGDISVANITSGDDGFVISDKLTMLSLDSASFTANYTLGTVADDIKTALSAKLVSTSYAISDINDVTSIALKTNPKTQYQVGDTLSLDESIVALTTKSGVVRELPLTSTLLTVTGFDSTTASDSQTITVSYSDTISTTYTVEIKNLPQVTSIAIKTSPKTEYAYGEALDLTGGVVTLNYDNDTSSELNLTDEAFAITGFDSKTISSSMTITVDYNGVQITYTVSVAAPVVSSTKYWVVDRADSAKVSGSNYEVSSIVVPFENGAKLNGTEEYWGVEVVNLLATPARVRYGFELSGAVCWIGAVDTKLYLVSKDGTIKEWTMTNAQYIDIPANFDGTIYLKKTDAYGWTTDTTKDLVKNGYVVKGIRLGYDFRNEYAAKLALGDISVANITSGDDGFVVSDKLAMLSLDGASFASNIVLGTVADDIKTALSTKLVSTLINRTALDTVTAIAIKVAPRTEYALGEVADYKNGIVSLTCLDDVVRELPLTSELFAITGFNSHALADSLTLTVTYNNTNLTTTFNIKVVGEIPSADDEDGNYIILNKATEINAQKTGWTYIQFALKEWRENGENATGTGNCIGLRVESVNTSVTKVRFELRSHNATDDPTVSTHRTGMWKNANAFIWGVLDGTGEVVALTYDKTSQYVQIPAGFKGTIYARYDTDFSWKGHTAEYGISHFAIGFDMRSANTAKLVIKELFDAYYTISDTAKYTDILDDVDNGAGVNTHFTTDVTIVNFKRFFSTKEFDVNDIEHVADAEEHMDNCKKTIQILTSPNYAVWTVNIQSVVEEELAKISVTEYDPDDYIVQSISMKTLPKAEYTQGDLANWEAGVVTLKYKSGREVDYSLLNSIFNVEGFTSLEPTDELTITVSLAADTTISTSFNVKINEYVAPQPEPKKDDKKSGCGSSMTTSGITIAVLTLAVLALVMIKKRKIN